MTQRPPPAGQRCLVIGTGAMAVATGRRLTAADAEVTISSRSLERAKAAAKSAGPSLRGVAADPEDPEALSRVLRELTPVHHVAVLAGGAGIRAAAITDTPLQQAQHAFGRFWATYNALQAAASHLEPEGSITALSGSSSRRGVAGLGVWGALHGSIEALARAAALELSPVRVNTVSPGGIGIGMDRQLTPHAGTPEDIASAVVFLISNPAVTGAVVDVDGGERLGTYTR